MRKTGAQLALALLAAPLLAGCGTMLVNVGGLSCTSGHYMEPYGGVKVCLEGGTQSLKEVSKPGGQDRLLSLLGGMYMLALDLPMSAVADTLTLPMTVRATLKGEAVSGPVRWDGGNRLMFRLPEEQPGPGSDSPQQ
jgi:uncharacterized protein YceK